MSVYFCKYYNDYLGCPKEVTIPTLGDVMNGFWLNEDYEFTKISDNKFWIPPSQIRIIIKQT